MKVTRILLENFKRFGPPLFERPLEIEVRNTLTQDVANQLLILGDNGSGKTTVLQAIALCLSMATGKTRSVEEFDWLGWVPGRYERWGRPRIELTVEFTEEERQATREVAELWRDALPERRQGFITPGNQQEVRLTLHGLQCRADSREGWFQFRGRPYAASLVKVSPDARDYFRLLPGVFWFDQLRNLGFVKPTEATRTRPEGESGNGAAAHVSYAAGIAQLRGCLNNWWMHRNRRQPPGRDFLADLETMYSRVFPGRKFAEPEPLYASGEPTPSDSYFMLTDGHRTYDIEEMSGGEQAVFPMLYKFVQQQIRNSVVLVDEIDLNLHPPLAQGLLAALPVIGPGCQFFYTTHSAAIAEVVSPHEILRLEGGRLCL
jgi:energy-coupling factor transporter ATP-binding protein EcfA2